MTGENRSHLNPIYADWDADGTRDNEPVNAEMLEFQQLDVGFPNPNFNYSQPLDDAHGSSVEVYMMRDYSQSGQSEVYIV